jgi:hypothetical protein
MAIAAAIIVVGRILSFLSSVMRREHKPEVQDLGEESAITPSLISAAVWNPRRSGHHPVLFLGVLGPAGDRRSPRRRGGGPGREAGLFSCPRRGPLAPLPLGILRQTLSDHIAPAGLGERGIGRQGGGAAEQREQPWVIRTRGQLP